MQIRKYKPGELICRMSKRSKLNSIFSSLNQNINTNLIAELETQKVIQAAENAINMLDANEDAPGQQGGETLVSGFVKRLT